MAPTSTSTALTVPTVVLQSKRLLPVGGRRVVPAIPLPYLYKRKQHEAALAEAKAREQAQAAAAAAAAASAPDLADIETEIEASSPPTPPASEVTPAAVNGEVVESSVEPSLPDIPLTPPTIEGEIKVEIGVEIEIRSDSAAETSSADEETPEPSSEAPPPIPSENPSSNTRPTYQMPPPFVPANPNQHQHQPNGGQYEHVVATQPHMYMSQPSIHHSHPSNGGSMIHGYSPSNHSSPAPPLSGGIMPPHPYPQQPTGGRHAPHPSNAIQLQLPMGYPVVGPHQAPFPPSMNHTSGAENFARHQGNPQNPPESFSRSGAPPGFEPRGNGFPPSAPRSLHGSQPSVTNDHESASVAYYGPHPTAIISNGSNGQIDEVRVHRPQKSHPESQIASGPNRFNENPPHLIDQFDGLISYLQSQYDDPAFADYRVELRFSDDRAQPVRVYGHGLIIGRSPVLRKLMDDFRKENSADGLALASHTLLLESGDRFLTSDGFRMAMQRLYGHGLLDLGYFNRPDPGSLPPPPREDQLTFALGYAAAGHILEMPPVTTRGMDFIANMLDFSTLERTLDFALDGGLSSTWMAPGLFDRVVYLGTYGPSVNRLIYRCLCLIVNKFPTDFVLDTSVGDPAYRRLPLIIENPRPASRNPRLDKIQFGYADEEPKEPSGTSVNLILSRVLLNLPFHLLKYVFESDSTLGDSPPTLQVRQHIIRSVVDEREKRRLKHWAAHARGEKATGHDRQWEAANWEEQVRTLERGNQASHAGPFLTLWRTWVDHQN